jgi:hypothetical protein
MNTVILIGRFLGIKTKLGISSSDDTHKLKLQVKRDFKEANGEYVSDTFVLLMPTFYKDILDNAVNSGNLRVNDFLSVNGRLVSNGNKIDVVVHKITFYTMAQFYATIKELFKTISIVEILIVFLLGLAHNERVELHIHNHRLSV